MKKKIGKFLIIAGWILIIVSIIMIIYNYKETNKAYSNAQNVLNHIDEVIDYQIEDIENKENIEVLGEKYIGIIEIPSLNIRLPVLKECNDINLKKSACNFYGNIYENENFIIAAHNYPKFFGNIKELNKDDKIYFIKIDGEKKEYKVEKTEIVSSDDKSGLIETNYELSLFTCNINKEKRITVRCIENI